MTQPNTNIETPAQKIVLNSDQQAALEAVANFIAQDDAQVLIIEGGAGTGKTTMITAINQLLKSMHRELAVLTPTGRAARVISSKTNIGASTIHSQIYNFDTVKVFEHAEDVNDPGVRFYYPIKEESPSNTVYLVDESSMVGDVETRNDLMSFGSGRLLHDLLRYTRIYREGRSALAADQQGCKIIFVGDPAQLPPVGDKISSAMSKDYLLKTFGIKASSVSLTQVMRQKAGSELLNVATKIREDIKSHTFNHFELPNTSDIHAIKLNEAIEKLVAARRSNEKSVCVVHSNAEAKNINRHVRGLLWGEEGLPLQKGDLLLVNKNSRGVTLTAEDGTFETMMPLFNGDISMVVDLDTNPIVRTVSLKTRKEMDKGSESIVETIELSYRRVDIAFRDEANIVRSGSCFIIENLLESSDRELSALEQRAMLVDFRKRHPDLKPNTEAFTNALTADPFYNALQVKYAYAMTCHKAQGGEWDQVYVFFGQNASANESFFRWSYTAMTRSKDQLYVINPPRFTTLSRLKIKPMFQPVTDWSLIEKDQEPTEAEHPATVHVEQPVVPMSSPVNLNEQPVAFKLVESAPQLETTRIKWIADALVNQGIKIQETEYLQYRTRMHVSSSYGMATLEYTYKGDGKIGSVKSVSGEADLIEQALPVMTDALKRVHLKQGVSVEQLPECVQALVNPLKGMLESEGVHLIDAVPQSYKVRLTFLALDSLTVCEIDVHYNSKQQLTNMLPVGNLNPDCQRLFGQIQQHAKQLV
ncbi:MAG TPA: AAA family ATPase [Thiotrichales bacterium]|nr:AAA family ATPase [Thiotrichales bacterium]